MIVTRHTCMTKDIGLNGNLFGGIMLAWLDEAAAIFAQQNASDDIVTLKISEVLFKVPVRVKDIVEIDCVLLSKGNSSMKISVTAMVGEKQVCSCDFVFVNVDSNGLPKKNEK